MTAAVSEQVSDAEIVAGFLRDPELFTGVHERYFRGIYRYVAGRLDVHVAEDIAAETFCMAFAQRERFDTERGTLQSWLFGIATNLVALHRRKETRRYRALARIPVEPDAASHEARVVASVAADRMGPQLTWALTKLSRGERDVVLLVALGQLSYEEVAHALNISQGTVGSRLTRARKKLRTLIEQEAFHG